MSSSGLCMHTWNKSSLMHNKTQVSFLWTIGTLFSFTVEVASLFLLILRRRVEILQLIHLLSIPTSDHFHEKSFIFSVLQQTLDCRTQTVDWLEKRLCVSIYFKVYVRQWRPLTSCTQRTLTFLVTFASRQMPIVKGSQWVWNLSVSTLRPLCT